MQVALNTRFPEWHFQIFNAEYCSEFVYEQKALQSQENCLHVVLPDMTSTAVVDSVKPRLNFLHYSMSKAVKLNIPRGGGPASACFSPTKQDLVTVTPTCLTSQRFEARSHRLMGVVWHSGPTPLIYPYWNLQALLRKDWVMSHDSLLTSAAACKWSSGRNTTERKQDYMTGLFFFTHVVAVQQRQT